MSRPAPGFPSNFWVRDWLVFWRWLTHPGIPEKSACAVAVVAAAPGTRAPAAGIVRAAAALLLTRWAVRPDAGRAFSSYQERGTTSGVPVAVRGVARRVIGD